MQKEFAKRPWRGFSWRVKKAHRLGEADLSKLIFVPGFQHGRADHPRFSGRGVGLDVVQNVMVRLKGSVSVESDPARYVFPFTVATHACHHQGHSCFGWGTGCMAGPVELGGGDDTRSPNGHFHLVDGMKSRSCARKCSRSLRLESPRGSQPRKALSFW